MPQPVVPVPILQCVGASRPHELCILLAQPRPPHAPAWPTRSSQDYTPLPAASRKAIKLTNEPPSGLKANLKRAYLNFTDAIWENSTKAA
eukprot:105553-Prymnesium_polylepis.1